MSRLIDADNFGNRMYHEAFEKDSVMQKWDSGCWIRYKLFEIVLREQPTVTPEPHWIPVTERLPGEDDYKPCYGYEDGAVWWFNDMGLMGLGWYYPSTGKWAYYDESDRCDKCVGNVVAWMPLPELYREEERDELHSSKG